MITEKTPVNEVTIRRLLETSEIPVSEKEKMLASLPNASEGELLKLLQTLSRKAYGENKLQHKTAVSFSRK